MITPKLWSKLGSAGEITSPEIGTAGSVVGSPTYPAAKFGNGILSNADSEGCTFPTAANSINHDKGTIEFWAKLNFEPNDADNHMFVTNYDGAGSGGFEFGFKQSIDDFRLQLYHDAGNFFIDTTGETWSSGDLIHFAIVWDRTGTDIGDSKTLVLYINGIEKVSSTTTWNADNINANLYVGTDRGGSQHSDAVIDNLKTYNVCKLSFNDRHWENGQMRGGSFLFNFV